MHSFPRHLHVHSLLPEPWPMVQSKPRTHLVLPELTAHAHSFPPATSIREKHEEQERPSAHNLPRVEPKASPSFPKHVSTPGLRVRRQLSPDLNPLPAEAGPLLTGDGRELDRTPGGRSLRPRKESRDVPRQTYFPCLRQACDKDSPDQTLHRFL